MPQKFCSKINLYTVRLVFFTGFGGFSYGYYSGLFFDVVLPYARNFFYDGNNYECFRGQQEELIKTVIMASFIMGAILSGWENDKMGRRGVLSMASGFFIYGAINLFCTTNVNFLIFGAGFMGLATGMTFTSSPLYIAEVSPKGVTGALVSTYSLQIIGGKFMCSLLTSVSAKEDGIWHRILGLVIVISQLLLLNSLPESPTWLYRKGRKDEAVEIWMKIYNNSDVEVAKVVNSICLSVETERTIEGSILHENQIIDPVEVYRSECKNVPIQRFIASIGCRLVQQLMGINIIMYHSPIIIDHLFRDDEYVTSNNMILNTYLLITTSLCAFGTIISITFLIDRYKRRSLLLTSMFGTITCLSLLYYVSYSIKISCERNEGIPIISFGFRLLGTMALGFYFIFYSLGVGTVPWLLNMELYPLRYRSLCGGMTIAIHGILTVLVNLLFTILNDKFGMTTMFLILIFCSLFFGLIIYLYLPETKGIVEGDDMLLKLDHIVKMT